MKYLLPLVFNFFIQNASAQVITNVEGISERLENIHCDGWGHLISKSNMEKIDQDAELQCQDVPDDQMDACFKTVVLKHTNPANVSFRCDAFPGEKEFEMIIQSRNTNHRFFHSIRKGFHGDAVNGITLMFNRVGVQDDEFMIETGVLSQDGNSTPMVMVPVKRRLLSDQVYFFFDCKLTWQK